MKNHILAAPPDRFAGLHDGRLLHYFGRETIALGDLVEVREFDIDLGLYTGKYLKYAASWVDRSPELEIPLGLTLASLSYRSGGIRRKLATGYTRKKANHNNGKRMAHSAHRFAGY